MQPSALTRYLCDLIDAQAGRITADEVRTRWREGRYPGVRKDWGAAYARLHGVG